MKYTIQVGTDKGIECEYYWISPEQGAFYYTLEVPADGAKGTELTRGYLPIQSVNQVTINEKQNTGN